MPVQTARINAAAPDIRVTLARIIAADDMFTAVPRVRPANGDPAIYCHTCLPGPAVDRLGRRASYTHCGGAGFTERDSWIAAAAEGIERYCAIRFSLDATFTSGAWADLPASAPAPEAWCLFSTGQYASPGFPCQPFTARTPVKWYAGMDLHSGTGYLLPGPMVCFPYLRRPGESRVIPATTTGLAFGANRDSACLSALWEVIERDAVSLAWSWRIPIRRIDAAQGLPLRLARRANLDNSCIVDIFDITSDLGVPCAMVFLRLDDKLSGRRLLTVGAACRGTIQAALEKAFLEALQGIPYVRHLCREFAHWQFGGCFEEVQSFRHSAAFYSLFPDQLDRYLGENGEFLNMMENIVVPVEPDGPALNLAATLNCLEQRGFTAYAIPMEAGAVGSEGCCVTRVIIPGLYALEGAYRFRWRSDRRARAASRARGGTVTENLYPHPMP